MFLQTCSLDNWPKSGGGCSECLYSAVIFALSPCCWRSFSFPQVCTCSERWARTARGLRGSTLIASPSKLLRSGQSSAVPCHICNAAALCLQPGSWFLTRVTDARTQLEMRSLRWSVNHGLVSVEERHRGKILLCSLAALPSEGTKPLRTQFLPRTSWFSCVHLNPLASS